VIFPHRAREETKKLSAEHPELGEGPFSIPPLFWGMSTRGWRGSFDTIPTFNWKNFYFALEWKEIKETSISRHLDLMKHSKE
jgi:hypothetical protein